MTSAWSTNGNRPSSTSSEIRCLKRRLRGCERADTYCSQVSQFGRVYFNSFAPAHTAPEASAHWRWFKSIRLRAEPQVPRALPADWVTGTKFDRFLTVCGSWLPPPSHVRQLRRALGPGCWSCPFPRGNAAAYPGIERGSIRHPRAPLALCLRPCLELQLGAVPGCGRRMRSARRLLSTQVGARLTNKSPVRSREP